MMSDLKKDERWRDYGRDRIGFAAKEEMWLRIVRLRFWVIGIRTRIDEYEIDGTRWNEMGDGAGS
jgi:hypothetical protein